MIKRNLDVPWNYEDGDIGPANWHLLCERFKPGGLFPLQSPIKLKKAMTEPILKEECIQIHYQKQKFTEKEFKNTIHFVPFDQLSYILYQDEKYYLTDIHFHMPSEHVLDDYQAPLEFHLVHTSNQQVNLVLGILFETAFLSNQICHDHGDEIWDFDHHIQWFNPDIFLPENQSYYHYVGSLTTPPTIGPIQWFVFEEVGQMNQAFINLFKNELLLKNNRPLQPLKNRAIFYYKDQSTGLFSNQ